MTHLRLARPRLLIAALLFVATNVHAELLDDIAANLRQHRITRGVFQQQKTLPILTQPLTSSGRFLYDADHGILWRVEKPVSSQIIITANGIFQDGALLTSGGSATLVQTIFQGLLSGDMQALQTQFAIRVEGNRERWQMMLTPRAQPLSAAIATITLSGGSDAQQLTITEVQGSVTHLQLLQHEHPQQLSAAELKEFTGAR